MPSPETGPPGARRPTPRSADPATDPGRSQPFESLYRDSDGSVPESHRTTARHFEPSLSPPDDQPADDQYHWLYRPEPVTTSPSDEDTSLSPIAESPTWSQAPDGGSGSASTAPASLADDLLPEAGPPTRPTPGPRRRRVWPVVLLALLLVAAGVVLSQTRGERGATRMGITTQPAPSSSREQTSAGPARSQAETSSPSASPAATEPYVGAVLPLSAAQAEADCQAPPSTDGDGQPVGYDVDQLTDGDASTAWRCEGAGDGRTVDFTFPAETRIVELGIVNGYTKIDPRTRVDRYREYRRIREVKWTFGNGASFTQSLADDQRAPQKLRVPVQTANRVRLTIVKSTQPGGKAKSRDAVLISEATFAAPKL